MQTFVVEELPFGGANGAAIRLSEKQRRALGSRVRILQTLLHLLRAFIRFRVLPARVAVERVSFNLIEPKAAV